MSGSGLGGDVGETAEEAMRFAQMDADGGGSVSFAELVRPIPNLRSNPVLVEHAPPR